jgi:ribosome-associated protein
MTSAADHAREEARGRVSEACLIAARAADAKQGSETVILAMSDILAVTDAFVITSGRNTRQVRTIVDEVELEVKANGGPSPLRVEGRDDFGWVLMDYGDFVVHVFLDERRTYYDLERLWGDAPRVDWVSGTVNLPTRARENHSREGFTQEESDE